MALENKIPVDGLKKEDTGGVGADAMTTGIAFLYDGAKTTPAWSGATNFLIHYAYGLDLGAPILISKLICYDNRDTNDWYSDRDKVEVWVSADNVTYTFYQAYADPPRTAGVWELVFNAPQTARYFKVWCTSYSDGLWVDGGYWCQLVELEAWGEAYAGYFSGYVYEQGSPIQRKLYLHYRDDGFLIDTTTSSGSGYYYLETTYSGSHYIVCLDDEAGENYNDLIIGDVYPTTVSG